MKRVLAALAVVAAAATAAAQGVAIGPWQATRGANIKPNVDYTGQFTFVRLRYGPPAPYQSQRIPWTHDYPFGEQHFMQIMNEVTNLKPRTMESNVMGLDDPDLARFPVAYMAEPGYMFLTEGEVAGFRAYLRKGGFVIFDDFRQEHWYNFEQQMQRALPSQPLVQLAPEHPVFHAFFEIDPRRFVSPYGGLTPMFYGVFENNDPSKRLQIVANYNNDLGEYWEFSDTGWVPVDLSNEAYKFGVNYIVYGMTH